MFIRTNTRENDEIFLSPLKSINTSNFYLLQKQIQQLKLSTFCLGSQAYSCKNNLSKRADTNDGDYLIQFLVQRSTVLHVLYNVGSLSFIRSDDTYLLRLDVGSQKSCGNLLHVSCFSPRKYHIKPHVLCHMYTCAATEQI